jgi:hypothetical protein
MKPRGVVTLTGALLCATLSPRAAAPPTRPGAATTQELSDGAALAAEMRAQRPEEDASFQGALRVRDAGGRRVSVPFRCDVLVTGAGWRVIYLTSATDTRAAEMLVVKYTAGQAPQFLLARAPTLADPLPEPAATEDVMRGLGGSDFALADLGRAFLYWPQQRLVRSEMRRGRSCQVLDSSHPAPAPGQYARVRTWVDRETLQPLRAEAYGADNKLLKEFSVGSVRKIKGRWELQEIVMRNELTDSRTILEVTFDP